MAVEPRGILALVTGGIERVAPCFTLGDTLRTDEGYDRFLDQLLSAQDKESGDPALGAAKFALPSAINL